MKWEESDLQNIEISRVKRERVCEFEGGEDS